MSFYGDLPEEVVVTYCLKALAKTESESSVF